jgi:transcriptional regulator with XRE-family HTH domain
MARVTKPEAWKAARLKAIGKAVKDARKKLGISSGIVLSEMLSKEYGDAPGQKVSQSELSYIERGRESHHTQKVIDYLIKLGANADDFIIQEKPDEFIEMQVMHLTEQVKELKDAVDEIKTHLSRPFP